MPKRTKKKDKAGKADRTDEVEEPAVVEPKPVEQKPVDEKKPRVWNPKSFDLPTKKTP
jgi:hypothetical protein